MYTNFVANTTLIQFFPLLFAGNFGRNMTRYGQTTIIGPKQKMDENCSSPNWLSSSCGSVFWLYWLVFEIWSSMTCRAKASSFEVAELAIWQPESERHPIECPLRKLKPWCTYRNLLHVTTPQKKHLIRATFGPKTSSRTTWDLGTFRNETREPSPTAVTVPNLMLSAGSTKWWAC